MRNLTNREWEVVGLLARGWSARRIAEALDCSARTIEEHTARIAATIPNPDNLPPRTRVILWARDHQHTATS